MQPGSLSLPPDRPLDDNSNISDHHHHHHHCAQPKQEDNWGQHQAHDAGFYAPGNSSNSNMSYDQQYGGQPDGYHGYNQAGTYGAEEVMTPGPVHGSASHHEHPAAYHADAYQHYGSEYYGHAHGHHYPPMQENHDQDMSDSDGGVPLNNIDYAEVANNNPMTGNATASNVHFHQNSAMTHDHEAMDREDDDDADEEGEEEEEEDDSEGEEEGERPEHADLMDHTPGLTAAAIPAIIQYLQGVPPAQIQASFPPELIEQAAQFLLAHQPLPPEDDEISLDEEEEQLLDPFPPVHMSNPNPSILGSENYGLIDFLRYWAYGNVSLQDNRLPRPGIHRVLKQATSGVERVYYTDLRADGCDMQGLNWESMNTTRYAAREIRRFTYKNYVNRQGSDIHHSTETKLPSTDNFFRFKKMDVRRDISLAHFQLRSVLACPTRTHAYYPSPQGINVLNTATKKTKVAMNLRVFSGMAGPAISALDAGCGVLMAGTFNGDYFLQALGAEDKKAYSEGQISSDISGITNHIKIYKPRRSGSPVAAIASNDQGFRLMDIQTQKFTAKFTYPFALNCSAMSPDGRLRVVVGDDLNVLITNAETGEVLQQLSGHRDYGFACDWSENGYSVATGFQDRTVKIWDARRWHNAKGVPTPLCTITTEMAGVRNLRFSPTGSGRPILAAAEEADYINLIDAQTFQSKQTIDILGEIGGVAFTNQGQDLNILCCDAHRGGLLQFERCSFGIDEPVSGGWQRAMHADDEAVSTTWNDVQRRRPPMYLDGPGFF